MANWYIEDEILYLLDETVSKGRIQGLIENLMNLCQYLYDVYFSDGHFDDSIEGYEDAVADVENYANEVGEELECTLVCLEDDLGILTWAVEETGDLIVWFDGDGVCMVSVESPGSDADEPTDKVFKWSWDKLNGTNTKNVETMQKAKKAINGEVKDEATGEKYGPNDFSFNVWNDLCEKVLKFRKILNWGWLESVLSFENTKMNENSRFLSADRFNSLRINIEANGDGMIEDVGMVALDGNNVNGGYIDNLVIRLNNLIDYYKLA